MPAPVLVAQYPSLAVWTWAFANPARWNAYNSLDGGATYQFDDFVVGTARQYAPDGGQHLMFIVGVDANGKEITRRSNAVRPDDAAPPVPGAPQFLSASDDGFAIQLDWTLGSGPITGQRIYRKVDAGSFALWQTVAGNVTHATNSGVISAHLYTYYVIAYNGVGDSAPSNQVSILFNAS
jgi:hypothetical protein